MANKLILTELKTTDLQSLGDNVTKAMQALSSSPKRILKFDGAILARKEVNKNRDDITAENLNELQATLPLNWIDVGHKTSERIGFYIDAKVMGDALSTSGIIWTDDDPEIPSKLASGELQFSMEAVAQQAKCSLCSKTFASESEYCEHISTIENRFKFNANRQLIGMTAVGGAVTPRPAGTDTRADPNQIQMIAHVVMAKDMAKEEEPVLSFMGEAEYTLWSNQPSIYAKMFGDDGVMGKKLSTKDRKGLSDAKFALTQKKDGKTIRRFPINDCNHARNALSRLSSAKDLTSAERAQVKRKAQAKLNSPACKTDSRAKSSAILAAQRFFAMDFAGTPTVGDFFHGTGWFHPVMSPVVYINTKPFEPAPLGKHPVTERTAVAEKVSQVAEQKIIASTDTGQRIGGLAWLPTPQNSQPADKVVWK